MDTVLSIAVIPFEMLWGALTAVSDLIGKVVSAIIPFLIIAWLAGKGLDALQGLLDPLLEPIRKRRTSRRLAALAKKNPGLAAYIEEHYLPPR